MVSVTECPKCHLPREDSAWQCDGCGYAYRQDFDQVRSELRGQLARSRIALVLALVIDLGLVAAVVWLALHGWIYMSLPVALGAISFTGYRIHRISVLRAHLHSLDRTHVPLPQAQIKVP